MTQPARAMSAIPQKVPETNLQAVPAPASDKFPPGIPFIVGNEGAERFSFYGMKAILKVYMMALFLRFIDEKLAAGGQLAEATAKSTEVVHLFVAGVYAFPLVGAIISDRWLGKYRVIFWLSLVYCLGHAALAVAGRFGEWAQQADSSFFGKFGPAEWGMYIGLALIAIGSGGIKPCVSANVGDQFTKENGHLVTKVFQIFYFIINYGSFFSTLITPLLYKYFGPEIAFGVPGILMGIATVIFWAGRNKFVKVPPKPGGLLGFLDAVVTLLLLTPLLVFAFGGILPTVADHLFTEAAPGTEKPGLLTLLASKFWIHGVASVAAFVLGLLLFSIRQKKQPDNSFLPVLIYAIRNQKSRKAGQSFFDVAREKFGEEAGDGPPAVLRIMLVFAMVSVFWALFDQHASTWIDQAKMMNLELTTPAMIGRWIVVATLALSFYGGIWLFTWISNVALPRKLTFAVLGVVLGAGALAGIADLAFPSGDLVDGVKGRMMTIVLEPAQLSALNPLMVMIIIPALNALVYAPLKKRGIEVKPLQKMVVGMFLASAAFASAAILQKAIEVAGVGKVHGLWQALPYLIMTTAEVLVSITGLEFAYTQAPRAMKSTIMGFWLLCVTFGNLLVAFLSPLQKSLALSEFFWVFAALMAGAAFLFAVMAYFYKGKTYLQEAVSH